VFLSHINFDNVNTGLMYISVNYMLDAQYYTSGALSNIGTVAG